MIAGRPSVCLQAVIKLFYYMFGIRSFFLLIHCSAHVGKGFTADNDTL